MATVDPIKVKGLREFQASLKEMDGESQKLLRVVLNKAADVVVKVAQGKASRDTKRGAASIKASSSQREAKVKGGGAKLPWYPFMDFGGSVGRGHIPRKADSGAIKRPFYAAKGRYIYKAYHETKDEVHDVLVKELIQLAKDSGFDVEQT